MTTFSVWAPEAGRVEVTVAGTWHDLSPDPRPGRPGWWAASVDGVTPADYAFRLDGGEPLPDPRSLRQPSGPAGPSRTFDPGAFAWSDGSWRGAPLAGAVIYELHVGTFTEAGTLDAAIGRLPYLRDLGVTAVELMPLASFPGGHGWGYDGIGVFAVHEPYGGPAALQRFTDAAHGLGLAVLLDVVYNHVGPGNQLAAFGPYFTSAHTTPWGPAVNLDQPGSDEVRAFIVDNALMWLRDFHLDGLRLDAVHAIEDHRAVHILETLAAEVDSLSAATGRAMILIAESDLNDPRLISRRPAGGYGLDGQWCDDFHHAVHAAVTGERQGYYGDFGSMACLAKVFARAYFHDGIWSSFRERSHGRPVDVLAMPSYRFVVFLQDHDQVGNRATGDRLPVTLEGHPHRDGLLRVASGLVLLSPFTPMLFMGEEWGADTPWQFFSDHTDPLLASAVSEGRRSEFASHGWGFADVPDPQDPATFSRSKLSWSQPLSGPHDSLLAWYRALLTLRRARPELTDPAMTSIRVSYDEDARWLVVSRGPVRIAANLAGTAASIPLRPPSAPGSVSVSTSAPAPAAPASASSPAPPSAPGPAAPASTPSSAPAPPSLLLASHPDISVNPDSVVMPPASFAVMQVAPYD